MHFSVHLPQSWDFSFIFIYLSQPLNKYKQNKTWERISQKSIRCWDNYCTHLYQRPLLKILKLKDHFTVSRKQISIYIYGLFSFRFIFWTIYWLNHLSFQSIYIRYTWMVSQSFEDETFSKSSFFHIYIYIYIYSKRKQSMEASIILLFHMHTYLARPMSLVSSYRTYTKHVYKYHMHMLSAALNIHGVTSMHVYQGLHLYCFADK